LPVFNELYRKVKSGFETRRVISSCGKRDYQKQLAKELNALGNSEMWLAGKAVRALRPREKARAITKQTRGIAGRKA
jgi:ketol-acid reductoisomerase